MRWCAPHLKSRIVEARVPCQGGGGMGLDSILFGAPSNVHPHSLTVLSPRRAGVLTSGFCKLGSMVGWDQVESQAGLGSHPCSDSCRRYVTVHALLYAL